MWLWIFEEILCQNILVRGASWLTSQRAMLSCGRLGTGAERLFLLTVQPDVVDARVSQIISCHGMRGVECVGFEAGMNRSMHV